jgi:hypothetical protein
MRRKASKSTSYERSYERQGSLCAYEARRTEASRISRWPPSDACSPTSILPSYEAISGEVIYLFPTQNILPFTRFVLKLVV